MPSGRKAGGHSEDARRGAAPCEELSGLACRLPVVECPQTHQHASERACVFEVFTQG